MKRFLVALPILLLLTACAAPASDAGAEELQGQYAAMSGCTARLDAAIVTVEETQRYVLDVEYSGERTRVTVCEPEELSGVSATVYQDDTLTLDYDGMVLDAGSADPRVSAVNCPDIFLHAVAEGYVVEKSRERFEDKGTVRRMCFETEHGGEKLLVSAFFDEAGAPLYAELERGGEILAYLEFTNFVFGDILS